MSKIICDYCGTLFDPEKGPCPICGGEEEPETLEPTASEEPVSEQPPVIDSDLFDDCEDWENQEPQASAEDKPEEEPAEEAAEVPETEPEEVEESSSDMPAMSMSDTLVVRGKLSDLTKPAAEEVPAEEEDADSEAENSTVVVPVFTEDLDITLEELDAVEEPDDRPLPKALQGKKKRSKRRSRIVCAILAVLVALLALYIGYRFARPYIGNNEPEETTEATEPSASTTEATEPSKECVAILVEKNVSITEVGGTLVLPYTVSPEDTVDVVYFESDNPSVATVNESGVVTAVNAGRANITITCGSIMASCAVDCDFAPIETEPVTEPEPETRPANPTTHYLTFEDEIHLTGDVDEVTVSLTGEEKHLRLRNTNADGKVLKVEWVVEDSSILEMDWNSIVPKTVGTTIITGEYGGETYHCVVHVVE